MSDSELAYRVSGHCAEVVVCRYHRRNAFNQEALNGLLAALRQAESDPAIHALVLWGERVFSAGADVAELARGAESYRNGLGRLFVEAALALRTSPLPVVAAVEGYAFGGALMLALSCDFVVLAEGARVGFTEIDVGLIGGLGVVRGAVGRLVASRMVLLGERIRAREALELGLATCVVPDGQALDAARALAARLAELNPEALAAGKRLLASELSSEALLWEERDTNARLIEHSTATRAALARFLGPRPSKS